ncbi:MAG: VWA domain-containing protein [Deltaproteobacteria bacterium]
MKWAAPDQLIVVVAALAVVLGILRHGLRVRRRILDGYAEPKLQAALVPPRRLKRLRGASLCCGAAVLFLGLALMRPQWGSRTEKVPRVGIDLLFALDVSQSMLSQDILPSRLERAKLAIGDLVKKLNGDRVGLIAFAGDAYLACPLTTDYGGFLLTLKDVGPDTVGRPGTDIAAALEEAGKAFASASGADKTLILITDGEDHEGRALAAAEKLHAEGTKTVLGQGGVRIYTIGVGTREGELIPLRDAAGKIRFLKDDSGQTVLTRLDEQLLEKIALATKGVYVRSSPNAFGLDVLYKNYFSGLEKSKGEDRVLQIFTERFEIFLLFALMALVAQGILEALS